MPLLLTDGQIFAPPLQRGATAQHLAQHLTHCTHNGLRSLKNKTGRTGKTAGPGFTLSGRAGFYPQQWTLPL